MQIGVYDGSGSIFTVHAVTLERPLSDPKPAVRAANPIGRFWPTYAVALKVSNQLYRAIGIEVTDMEVDVSSDILIARPRARVFAYAADPDNAPTWYVNIKSVEWKTPPPVTIGSRIAFVAHFLGRRMAYTYEIVELIPEARLVMRTAEGPFPMETSYTCEATADGGTRMTLRNRGRPTGFSALVAPLMAHAMRRANRKDLSRLKELLEKDIVEELEGENVKVRRKVKKIIKE